MVSKLYKNAIILTALLLAGCGDEPMNDPYPQFKNGEKILYTAFTERPKHLDPAISYSADEATFTYQIYEPLLQYHYLKRPFQLIPLTTTAMPEIRYLDDKGNEVSQNADNVAFSVYRIQIKPNILYQDHPAFAKEPGTDHYYYHNLTADDVAGKHSINDFKEKATRELVAQDYIYEIKRLADPAVNSPIYGVLENYIVGFKSFSENLKKREASEGPFIDLRSVNLEGVKEIDKYTFEITVQGKYPQFLQWLAMPFFAPIPWEAAKFYSQPVLQKRNITLDWYPIGTGPFVLAENNPNMIMILDKNKNFHGETFPEEGEPGDEALGYLINKGKPLPLVDKVVFVLEKEDIPYWNKFLQGYYDQSGVSTNNFDQALKSMNEESLEISDELKSKGITLNKSVLPTVFYWGFNMLDETVGGYSEKNKKLRRALAIAFDMEEYVSIFLNGRGDVAQNPLPEGIFGYRNDLASVNKSIYDVDNDKKTFRRKNIEEAKQLLKEAGYPNGINPKTKEPLSLSIDLPVSSGPDSAAQLSWFRKQFEKIGIELVIKATQYSRFQDKILNGDMQIFVFGWNADYPDPENIFFLFDSENGKVKYRGENSTNYSNPEFDKRYKAMKVMLDSEPRKKLIDEMNDILRADMPWMAAYNPTLFSLKQKWVSPTKPNPIARNTIKYISVDPVLREQSQKKWNNPILYPVLIFVGILILICLPAIRLYLIKTRRPLVLRPRKE